MIHFNGDLNGDDLDLDVPDPYSDPNAAAVRDAIVESFRGKITTTQIYSAIRGGITDAFMLGALRDPAFKADLLQAVTDGVESAQIKISRQRENL